MYCIMHRSISDPRKVVLMQPDCLPAHCCRLAKASSTSADKLTNACSSEALDAWHAAFLTSACVFSALDNTV